MGEMASGTGITNRQLIMDSLLYKYVGSLGPYKCPADRKTIKDLSASKEASRPSAACP